MSREYRVQTLTAGRKNEFNSFEAPEKVIPQVRFVSVFDNTLSELAGSVNIFRTGIGKK